MIQVTVEIVRSVNVTAEIKGTIGMVFSGVKDDFINGNTSIFIDQIF